MDDVRAASGISLERLDATSMTEFMIVSLGVIPEKR